MEREGRLLFLYSMDIDFEVWIFQCGLALRCRRKVLGPAYDGLLLLRRAGTRDKLSNTHTMDDLCYIRSTRTAFACARDLFSLDLCDWRWPSLSTRSTRHSSTFPPLAITNQLNFRLLPPLHAHKPPQHILLPDDLLLVAFQYLILALTLVIALLTCLSPLIL